MRQNDSKDVGSSLFTPFELVVFICLTCLFLFVVYFYVAQNCEAEPLKTPPVEVVSKRKQYFLYRSDYGGTNNKVISLMNAIAYGMVLNRTVVPVESDIQKDLNHIIFSREIFPVREADIRRNLTAEAEKEWCEYCIKTDYEETQAHWMRYVKGYCKKPSVTMVRQMDIREEMDPTKWFFCNGDVLRLGLVFKTFPFEHYPELSYERLVRFIQPKDEIVGKAKILLANHGFKNDFLCVHWRLGDFTRFCRGKSENCLISRAAMSIQVKRILSVYYLTNVLVISNGHPHEKKNFHKNLGLPASVTLITDHEKDGWTGPISQQACVLAPVALLNTFSTYSDLIGLWRNAQKDMYEGKVYDTHNQVGNPEPL